ncbi:MAG: EAL domain-containing protein [Polyangiaceae bacterium]|nr:EAL domain-containing protein [Polyangiaceae bacterium]
MSDSKRPGPFPEDPADAARAFAERSTTTATRISALVANAGLGCRFRSILTASGEPYAELALLFASDGDRAHGERTILRRAGWSEILKAAGSFRERAVTEFASAQGLLPSMLVFLPFYCALPEVEAIGPSLEDIFAQHRIAPSRVISEVVVPTMQQELTNAMAQVAWMRALGIRVALRVESPDEPAAVALAAVTPDFLHLLRPPGSESERQTFRAIIAKALAQGARTILGGVDTDDAALSAEGLDAALFYGDAIAPPRFLC